MEYDAFISYSRTASSRLAEVVESELRAHASGPDRRIFRDAELRFKVCPTWPERIQENLLGWKALFDAMSASRWLVLLASPEAAQSWAVNLEIEYWLRTKTIDRIAVVAATTRQPSEPARNPVAPATLPVALRDRVPDLPVVVAVDARKRPGAQRETRRSLQQLAMAIYEPARAIGAASRAAAADG